MHELYFSIKLLPKKKCTVLEILTVSQGGTHDVHGEKCYPNIPAGLTTLLTKVNKQLIR